MVQKEIVNALKMGGVEVLTVKDGQFLPLVLTPQVPNLDLHDFASKHKGMLNRLLYEFGGLLFRGFDGVGIQQFESFVEETSGTPLKYTERSSPRSSVAGRVYTSTDHPEDKEIFLHCEQSYNLSFPLKIYFYCVQPAQEGGHTPIADTRKIFNRISPQTRNMFFEKHYRYARYFWPMMSMTWQKVFQTEDKREVEDYCKANRIEYCWEPDNALSTYQIRPVAAQHPVSGDVCWFNHCTFFNLSTLDPDTKEIFLESFNERELPNQTYFGDGGRIDDDIYNELRMAYESEKVLFDWQKGDILMLDNMLCAHGRSSYKGPRMVLAAMSEPTEWKSTQYQVPVEQQV
jgi:alpha-ketoglutarate-dependent taurine dioxygenase